jgi:diguanylate cyclase (GGDEF)-like protein
MFTNIINLGTDNKPARNANRIKTLNIISLLTAGVATGYMLFYLLVIQQKLIALINCLFILAYIFPILFNYLERDKLAKIWFFVVLMSQLFLFTNIIFTPESGFHLYHCVIPTGAFLLFNFEDKLEKYTISIASVIVFLISHNLGNDSPMVVLSAADNSLLFQSVILVNIIEVIAVFSVFTRELESSHKQLEMQANKDALTNTNNRWRLFNLAPKLLEQSKYHQRHLAVLLIDFDHFKQVNDNYGHANGDICLKACCERIKKHLRVDDFFARFGGEEFAVLLPDTTGNEAKHLAERIRNQIEAHPIELKNQQLINCTVSIGIATTERGTYEFNTLLKQADQALYHSKENGRNITHHYHKGLAA